MTTSTVRLIVKISGKLASDDDVDVELEPPALDRITKSIRIRDKTTGSTLLTYTFQYVKPGNYRISIDGQKTWKHVVVAASPEEQTIEFSDAN